MDEKRYSIAQVINSFSKGGAELLSYAIAKGISNNISSHVISISSCKFGIKSGIIDDLNSRGVKTYSLNKKPHGELFKAIISLRRYIKENHLKIIHTHCESPDVIGRIATLGLNVKLISTLHTHYPYPGRRLRGWCVERCLNFKTSKLVECSPHMEKAWRYLGYIPEKVVSNPNGIDPSRFRLDPIRAKEQWSENLNLPKDALFMVSVGRVVKSKGHDVLVQSFHCIHAKYPKLYLIIAGAQDTEPEFYHYVSNLVEEKGLKGKVLLIGEINDVPSLMAAADLIVIPSRWEGLSLAFLETLAVGKPFISTRIVPHIDVLPPDLQKNLVAPDSVDELSKKIEESLQRTQVQVERGNLTRKLVEEQFNESQMIGNYVKIYEEVLNQSA